MSWSMQGLNPEGQGSFWVVYMGNTSLSDGLSKKEVRAGKVLPEYEPLRPFVGQWGDILPLEGVRILYGCTGYEYFRGRIVGHYDHDALVKKLAILDGFPVFATKTGGVRFFSANPELGWEVRYEGEDTLFSEKDDYFGEREEDEPPENLFLGL